MLPAIATSRLCVAAALCALLRGRLATPRTHSLSRRCLRRLVGAGCGRPSSQRRWLAHGAGLAISHVLERNRDLRAREVTASLAVILRARFGHVNDLVGIRDVVRR